MRTRLLLASLALVPVSSVALARPPAPAPLPPLPGGNPSASETGAPPGPPPTAPAPAGTQAAARPTQLATPQQLYEHVRRSVVLLQRNGVPMAIGTVLDGDGRILTSLSGLGGADGADVHYADGTSVHAKVGHSDKGTDLALLVPQSGKWTEGLSASESDPIGAPLRAMLFARGARLGPAEAGVKGRLDAHARDGGPLPSMLDVDLKGPAIAGAPLLDATGSVVAVLVRACKGAATTQADPMAWAAWASAPEVPGKTVGTSCLPAVMGAPVSAIRSFLAATQSADHGRDDGTAAATAPTPWLGIQGEAVKDGAVRGVRIVAVAPSSPAQQAGLKPNADVIVAADGKPIDSPEKLADAIAKHAAGDTVKLLVLGDGKFRDVPVGLRAASP